MLSRVAENLYWTARYIERAENTARLISATSQVVLDLPSGASFGWDVLPQVVGLDRLYAESNPAHDEASIMHFLIADTSNPSSILSCVHSARENSRRLRDVLPRSCWERVNTMYLVARDSVGKLKTRADRRQMLQALIEARQSVGGLLSECMSHDVAYQFLRIGEFLERADMTTRIVDIHAAVLVPRPQVRDDPAVALLWVGVLKSLSAYQMYLRHGSAHVRGDGVVDYLLNNRHFPRSVRFCLHGLESHLAELPRNSRSLRALRVAERRIDGMALAGVSPALRHEYLDAIQSDLAALHGEVTNGYFRPQEQPSSGPTRAVAA